MGETKSRFLEVGWLLDKVKASFIWDAPRAIDLPSLDDPSAKAVTACPGVLQHESRLFEVPCPIDVQLSIHVEPNGTVRFRNDLGKDSPINIEYLQQMLIAMPPDQWRHPKRPVIQIHTPYRFITDETCWIDMSGPFSDYKAGRWPGVVIGGRFQLDLWPRTLQWAFEWHDLDAPLLLKRGEPWFYVRFDGMDPSRSIRLLEADWTPELEEYVQGLEEVTHFVNKTLSLFKTARDRRPAHLLSRKKR